jgi:hypothetical protein
MTREHARRRITEVIDRAHFSQRETKHTTTRN